MKDRLLCALLLLALTPLAWGMEEDCPMVKGPKNRDYSVREDAQLLAIIERAHFSSDVELGIHGTSGTMPGGDIAYTLENYPNHPRALAAMMRLADRGHTTKPYGAKYSMQCYLERAVTFFPHDPTAKMIYATYLGKLNKTDEAIKLLKEADEALPNDPNIAYNLGLLFFTKKDYAQSLDYAHKAYAGGFPFPGLRDKLKKAGAWKEAPEAAPAPAPATPAISATPATSAAPAAQAPAPSTQTPPAVPASPER